MECLSFNHLHVDGSGGRTAGCSLQQSEHHSIQVPDEISPQEGKNMEVCSNIDPIFIEIDLLFVIKK